MNSLVLHHIIYDCSSTRSHQNRIAPVPHNKPGSVGVNLKMLTRLKRGDRNIQIPKHIELRRPTKLLCELLYLHNPPVKPVFHSLGVKATLIVQSCRLRQRQHSTDENVFCARQRPCRRMIRNHTSVSIGYTSYG